MYLFSLFARLIAAEEIFPIPSYVREMKLVLRSSGESKSPEADIFFVSKRNIR
jgi:hypothetical protein